jgi:hypothetical protein
MSTGTAREAGSGRPPRPLRMGRRGLSLLCCGALAVTAVGVAAGRGGPSEKTAALTSSPVCANVGKGVDRPAAVPANLLPSGTVLSSSKDLGDGRTLVGGIVPSDFRTAVLFFVTKLPAAGYVNGAGDAEMDEAEALFTGDGVSGKWKVNGILNCPGAVTLALFVKR